MENITINIHNVCWLLMPGSGTGLLGWWSMQIFCFWTSRSPARWIPFWTFIRSAVFFPLSMFAKSSSWIFACPVGTRSPSRLSAILDPFWKTIAGRCFSLPILDFYLILACWLRLLLPYINTILLLIYIILYFGHYNFGQLIFIQILQYFPFFHKLLNIRYNNRTHFIKHLVKLLHSPPRC